MTVKANQPHLYDDLELLFKRPPGPQQDCRQVTQTTRAHGRLETRTLLASSDIKGYLDWPGVEQGLALERRVTCLATGEISTERVYGLTSLSASQLDLSVVLLRWRGHWSIENRLHWVKDVVLKEDASHVRTGKAPLVMAMLRNALVSCLHVFGFDSISQGRRHLSLNLDEAIVCVCGLSE